MGGGSSLEDDDIEDICMGYAVMRAVPSRKYGAEVYNIATNEFLDELVREVRKVGRCGDSVASFNDHYDRTKEQIVSILQEVEAKYHWQERIEQFKIRVSHWSHYKSTEMELHD